MILDDPVVYNGQPARNVRMCVTFAGYAMCRPARMRNPRVATGLRLVSLRGQFRDPPDRTQAMQAFLVDQRQARRVVAPVLEPAQPAKKNGNDIAVRDPSTMPHMIDPVGNGERRTMPFYYSLLALSPGCFTGLFHPGMDTSAEPARSSGYRAAHPWSALSRPPGWRHGRQLPAPPTGYPSQ